MGDGQKKGDKRGPKGDSDAKTTALIAQHSSPTSPPYSTHALSLSDHETSLVVFFVSIS